MIGLFDRLARPLLYSFDPEQAHRLAIQGLKISYALPCATCADDPRLASRVFGLDFENPVGLAAGFDKNAQVPDALMRLGFGFVEIGSVTPRPQTGNPRPRMFRLDADRGVINRLGFNNDGEAAVLARLAARKMQGVLGVNVGANRDAADRIADYVRLVESFAAYASYLTINISSPNTPGLRDLQEAQSLDLLVARVLDARDRVAAKAGRKPILVKIAPDLALDSLDAIVGVLRKRGVDGMIVGNTTITRPASLRETSKAKEQGGLSGRPLFPLATRMLAETYLRVDKAFPLVGVGGIDSGATALAKIKAGAALVQLYSGLVFGGLGLIGEIKNEIVAALRREPQATLADFVGRDAAAVVAQPWPQ